MRVLHVITGLETGGAELMLVRLLEQSDRNRFESSVVSLTDIGPTGRQLEAAGVPARALGMRRGRPDPRGVVALAREIRRQKPDVIQTWLYHADLFGGLAAKLAGGTPVAWGLHLGNLAPEVNKRATMLTAKACARLSGRLPRAIVCCAESSRDAHIAYGYRADRMLVIPNGFDLDRFQPSAAARLAVRQELGLAPDTPLVGLIARFDPQKDHATFVEAAARLHQRRPDVRFVLCGGEVTWENPQLASWIADAGIRSVTQLLGRRDDMARIQAALDVAASSSAGEAFPLAVGEAMACGVPCVVTDVGDSALVVGMTGRVVPARDPDALTAGIGTVLDLPPDARADLGRAARQRIAENFSLARAVGRYEDLYERLAAGIPVPSRLGATL